MSSGSYFTIYRKFRKNIASKDKLDTIREEYYKSNKSMTFGSEKSEEALRADVPILLEGDFKANLHECGSSQCFYDKDGVEHLKLLSFHFSSAFTCLKELWNMNPYVRSQADKIVSKDEAAKILQAAKYVLSGEYSHKFEEILSNEYVELLGEEYLPFASRFSGSRKPIYVDREAQGYKITYGDLGFEEEEAECVSGAKYMLERVVVCLEAYMQAECYDFDGEELILEYSVY